MQEVDLGTTYDPWPTKAAKELVPAEKSAIMELLREYKDVFVWTYSDMQGLNRRFYQHYTHLNKDAKPVQQR